MRNVKPLANFQRHDRPFRAVLCSLFLPVVLSGCFVATSDTAIEAENSRIAAEAGRLSRRVHEIAQNFIANKTPYEEADAKIKSVPGISVLSSFISRCGITKNCVMKYGEGANEMIFSGIEYGIKCSAPMLDNKLQFVCNKPGHPHDRSIIVLQFLGPGGGEVFKDIGPLSALK